jgi:hypothetical protein
MNDDCTCDDIGPCPSCLREAFMADLAKEEPYTERESNP